MTPKASAIGLAAIEAAAAHLPANEDDPDPTVLVEWMPPKKWAPWQTLLLILAVGGGFWGAVFFAAWRML
jgi:hypothetical protein